MTKVIKKEEFDYFLKEERERAGISQRELAKKVGVHHTHISHAEAERTPISFELYKKIKNYLKTL